MTGHRNYRTDVPKRVMMLLIAVGLAVLAPGAAAGAQSSDGPSQVFVGAFVNDVKEVHLESNDFSIDLYVWFRWSDPDINPAVSIEPMNPRDAWLVETPLYDEPEQLSDGSYYNVVRFIGSFSTKLPLEDYPFDRQVLTVILEDAELPTTELVYVADPLSPTDADPDIEIPGWRWDDPTVTVVAQDYPGNWGNIDDADGDAYSRVLIEIPVHRPEVSSAIKMFFPLGLVLLTGVLTFFLPPRMVESKIGTAITALLTLVALQFTVMGALPAVGYLTMIEIIYTLSYMFVLYTLAMSIYTAWSKRDPDSREAVRFDRRSVAYGVGVYLAAVTATLVGYLT